MELQSSQTSYMEVEDCEGNSLVKLQVHYQHLQTPASCSLSKVTAACIRSGLRTWVLSCSEPLADVVEVVIMDSQPK